MEGYQPRSNLVKDDNGDLFADSDNILDSWKNFFCHLLNVCGVNDARQGGMHRAEPLLPEPSCFMI
jgi:hypothetical protein